MTLSIFILSFYVIAVLIRGNVSLVSVEGVGSRIHVAGLEEVFVEINRSRLIGCKTVKIAI